MKHIVTAALTGRHALNAGKRSLKPGIFRSVKVTEPCTRFLAKNSTLVGHDNVVKSPYDDVHIPEMNICHYLINDFSKYSNNTALVDGATGKEWTYAQLKDAVVKVGSALVKQGFKPGDVVTICSPNCPEFAIMYLAAIGIGVTASAVNPVYTAGELQHAVSHSGSKLIITVPALVPVAKEAAKSCPSLKEIVVFGESEGCRPFSSYLDDDGKSFPDNLDTNAKFDMACLPYSSGTTGLPKGVMLSHYNVVSNIEQLRCEHVMNYTSDDVLLGVLPFFHIYGQVVLLLTGLIDGCKTVTMPKFDPENYLKLMEKYGVTYLHLAPPIALFLAKHPMVAKYDLKSVRQALIGAAPVASSTLEACSQRFNGAPMRNGYGLTETSPVTHANPYNNHKYETIGVAVPNIEFKIADIETGANLGEGEEGELAVRGPNVMLGYFKNPEATANTIKDGWLHTGDIGFFDSDGHVTISDRLKELIKVKGFQVAPAELEALLVTHPKIQDAAVIGLPDERAGELPRAYVVPKPGEKVTEDDVKEFVKGKVAPYKELQGGVEFRAEIPKSASGKILRRTLKDELKAQHK